MDKVSVFQNSSWATIAKRIAERAAVVHKHLRVFALLVLALASYPLAAQTSPQDVVIRVNAGGPQYTDSSGNLWSADYGYNIGEASISATAVTGTNDPALFATSRWTLSSNPPMEYSFNVPNGTYQVKLYFAELYDWAGARIFSVQLEGQTILPDLEIRADAGGANIALIKTATATVTDGQVNITFLPGATDAPVIHAIEIIGQASTPPSQTPIRVNAGGPEYVDSNGHVWAADYGYNIGEAALNQTPVSGTADPELFRTSRWTLSSNPNLEYSFAVANGTYEVNLSFSEVYDWPGSRIFSVQAEGVTVFPNLEVRAEAGGANKALIKTANVVVTDGEINLTFLLGAADAPMINAIEILPQGSPPTGNAIKWHPGVYAHHNFIIPLADSEDWGSINDAIDSLADKPEIKGSNVIIYWGNIERGFNQYYWDEIDAVIARHAAIGKRVSLHLWGRKFIHDAASATPPPTPLTGSRRFAPDYLIDSGGIVGFFTPDQSGNGGYGALFPALWRAEVMDRYIALLTAIGNRYNGNPWVEAIETEETSVEAVSDYSLSGFAEQWRRCLTQVAPAWPNTIKLFHVNWFENRVWNSVTNTYEFPETTAIMKHAENHGWGFSGPDMILNGPSDGDSIARGRGIVFDPSVNANVDYGTDDRRGKVPLAYHNEWLAGNATFSAAAVEVYSYEQIQNTHFMMGKTDDMGPGQNWDDGGYAAIQATGGRIHNPQCPSNFASCNTN